MASILSRPQCVNMGNIRNLPLDQNVKWCETKVKILVIYLRCLCCTGFCHHYAVYSSQTGNVHGGIVGQKQFCFILMMNNMMDNSFLVPGLAILRDSCSRQVAVKVLIELWFNPKFISGELSLGIIHVVVDHCCMSDGIEPSWQRSSGNCRWTGLWPGPDNAGVKVMTWRLQSGADNKENVLK